MISKSLDSKARYRERVHHELKKDREVSAIFLVFGYLEYFLREWALVLGRVKNVHNSSLDKVNRFSLSTLSLIHVTAGNIEVRVFELIQKAIKIRDRYAHGLIDFDLNSEKIGWP